MVILALDTSSAATSAALIDGDRVLAVAEHVDARRHAELLARNGHYARLHAMQFREAEPEH